MAQAPFQSFSRQGVKFLVELTENNDRDWFKQNQPRYESLVREPTLAFIRAMEPRLRKISPNIVASDKKVGGSMMRPQRDTRFSPDKTPYKTNVGIYFRHAAGKDIHAPGLYLHFDPVEVFIGVGMWRPDGPSLAAVRKRIDEQPGAWKRARDAKAFRAYFDLDGNSLKRPPRGYDAEHPYIEDLKRKDHVGSCKMTLGDLFKPNFLSEVDKRFKASRGYLKFLCDALDLPF